MIRRPTKVFAVHGTGDYEKDAWYRKDQTFYKFARKHNIFLTGSLEYDDPFEWSGDVNGITFLSAVTLGKFGNDRKHRDWAAGGISWRNFIQCYPLQDRNCIIHSHALQVVAYSKVDLNNIITIGSPIRNDMMKQYEFLVLRAAKWMHIYDEKWDEMGFLGQIGDGKYFGSRRCEVEGVINVPIKKINHSKILRNEKEMNLWIDKKWFDFLAS